MSLNILRYYLYSFKCIIFYYIDLSLNKKYIIIKRTAYVL